MARRAGSGETGFGSARVARGRPHSRVLRVVTAAAFFASAIVALGATKPAAAETLADALVRAYQSSPQLNADRARQRATDENVPQALAGYRPQLVASLASGLQQVRNMLPDNSFQSATQRPWTIGLTVTQVLFNGFKTANSVLALAIGTRTCRESP